MVNDWQKMMAYHWQKWREEKPEWLKWGAVALGFILFYLIFVVSLGYIADHLQAQIAQGKSEATWMTRGAKEILRLRQTAPHPLLKSKESVFTLVNQAINAQGWSNLVTDVHQIEQNRVQVSFNSVSFNELIAWLQKLYDQTRIYVLEANFQKSQPGIVGASLILQSE